MRQARYLHNPIERTILSIRNVLISFWNSRQKLADLVVANLVPRLGMKVACGMTFT